MVAEEVSAVRKAIKYFAKEQERRCLDSISEISKTPSIECSKVQKCQPFSRGEIPWDPCLSRASQEIASIRFISLHSIIQAPQGWFRHGTRWPDYCLHWQQQTLILSMWCWSYQDAECKSYRVIKAAPQTSKEILRDHARNPWQGSVWSCGYEAKSAIGTPGDIRMYLLRKASGHGWSQSKREALWTAASKLIALGPFKTSGIQI